MAKTTFWSNLSVLVYFCLHLQIFGMQSKILLSFSFKLRKKLSFLLFEGPLFTKIFSQLKCLSIILLNQSDDEYSNW